MKVYVEKLKDGKGLWFELPVNQNEVFRRLALSEGDEYEISDYESSVNFKIPLVNNLNQMNRFAEGLEEMPRILKNNGREIIENCYNDVNDFMENWKELKIVPDIGNNAELGNWVVESRGDKVPESLEYYIDYAAIGRDFRINAFVFYVDGSAIIKY